MYSSYVYLAVLLYFGSCIHGGEHSLREKLYIKLTTGYYKDILPTLDHTKPLQLSMIFYMGTIVGFVEKESRLSITGSLGYSWYDYRLKWNSTEYGGIQSTTLPVTKVWVPPVQLFNAHNDNGYIVNDRMNVKCYNGKMKWYPGLLFDISCPADVTYYPFDSHTCYLYLSINGFSASEINITVKSKSVDMRYATNSPLWELDENKSIMYIETIDDDDALAVVGISFKRRPSFYIANLIVPTCLIGTLNNMVFILPAEAGERLGFSVTMLLAMAVFQTIVSDSVPTVSLPSIPRLCYFLLADLVMGSFITVCTMIVLRVYFKRDTERVPGKLQYLVSCMYHKRNPRKVDNNIEDVPCEITWHDVGQFLDVSLFCLFFILIILKNTILILMMTKERQFSLPNALYS